MKKTFIALALFMFGMTSYAGNNQMNFSDVTVNNPVENDTIKHIRKRLSDDKDAFERKMFDSYTQDEYIGILHSYVKDNKYKLIPTEIKVKDDKLNDLIEKYNDFVLQRNKLIKETSENSVVVLPLTKALDKLNKVIVNKLSQDEMNCKYERRSIEKKYNNNSLELK